MPSNSEILFQHLSKGGLLEDVSSLLGSSIVTKLSLKKRPDEAARLFGVNRSTISRLLAIARHQPQGLSLLAWQATAREDPGFAPGRGRGVCPALQPRTSGQIKLRRIDGWRKIAAVLSQHPVVAA